MIYLDNAANTPVNEEVLETFIEATRKYIANPNSSHKIGVAAKEAIDNASTHIAKYFHCNKESIIYTSGASESNNLVLKGIAERNKKQGNHIIISALEHSSIIAPCNYLSSHGYDVSILPITKEGIIDLEELKNTINDRTILVSICAVDSELGTIQPINEIAKIVNKYPNCIFHTDATQAIGKTNIDFTGVDFITFAPHKFFGLNGFGALININNHKLIPLIHGGKSTTIYRSGTPVTANVLAMDKALTLAIDNLEQREKHIKELNKLLREHFKKNKKIHINSPENSIPNTLNISLIDTNTKEVLHKLEEKEIYLSTTTACAIGDAPSKSVLAITGDKELASNTIRISISYNTTKEDIDTFIKEFDNILKKYITKK